VPVCVSCHLSIQRCVTTCLHTGLLPRYFIIAPAICLHSCLMPYARSASSCHVPTRMTCFMFLRLVPCDYTAVLCHVPTRVSPSMFLLFCSLPHASQRPRAMYFLSCLLPCVCTSAFRRISAQLYAAICLNSCLPLRAYKTVCWHMTIELSHTSLPMRLHISLPPFTFAAASCHVCTQPSPAIYLYRYLLRNRTSVPCLVT
jgi:hypothetical protein